MKTLWKVIDGFVYAGFGFFVLYCAWAMRGVQNPPLPIVAALFFLGIVLISFGVRSFCYGRIRS